jgi:hypothetical protein
VFLCLAHQQQTLVATTDAPLLSVLRAFDLPQGWFKLLDTKEGVKHAFPSNVHEIALVTGAKGGATHVPAIKGVVRKAADGKAWKLADFNLLKVWFACTIESMILQCVCVCVCVSVCI